MNEQYSYTAPPSFASPPPPVSQFPTALQGFPLPPEPPAPNKTIRTNLAVVGMVLALLVGLGAGALIKPVSLSSCTEALDHAEHMINLAAQGFGYDTDAIDAISNGDMYAVQSSTADMQALLPQVQEARTQYESAASRCRG